MKRITGIIVLLACFLSAVQASHGYPYTFVSSEGGHSWENWRRYLVDFLQRIFYP